ncbi:Myoglobin [Bienertia sinuspersici]
MAKGLATKGRNKEMEEVESLMAKRKTLFINKKRSPVEVGDDETNSQNVDNIGGWEANEDDEGRKCHAKEKEKVVFNKENKACMHWGTHFALMEHKGDDACGSDSQNSCNSFLFSMGSSFDQRRRPKIIKKAAGTKGMFKGDKVYGSSGNYKRKMKRRRWILMWNDAGATIWKAIGIYGWPNANNKHLTWDLMRSVGADHQIPILMFGDFNEIVSLEEKEGGSGWGERQMAGFWEAIDACQIRDLGFKGNKFTWCRGCSPTTFIRERLNRLWQMVGGASCSLWQRSYTSLYIDLIMLQFS